MDVKDSLRHSLKDLESFSVEFLTDSGDRFLLTSDTSKEFDGGVVEVDLNYLKAKGYIIIALYDGRWGGDSDCLVKSFATCDLPFGQMKEISIEANYANVGANLLVNKIAFLRSNPAEANDVSSKSSYAGRVVFEGEGVENVKVKMSMLDQQVDFHVMTDSSGFFNFSNVPTGSLVKIDLINQDPDLGVKGWSRADFNRPYASDRSIIGLLFDLFFKDNNGHADTQRSGLSLCHSENSEYRVIERSSADLVLNMHICH